MTEVFPLIADLHTVRCGSCKVLVDDPLVVKLSLIHISEPTSPY